MFFCSSPGSYVYDFCSSVEEVEQSEPSEHSWGEQKTLQSHVSFKVFFQIYCSDFFFPALLTFTWSRSGLPGRDFCVEKACKWKYKITKPEYLHAYQTQTWVRLLLTFFVCCTPSMDFDLFFTCFCGEVLVGHWTEMGGLNETFWMALRYYIILNTSVVFWSMSHSLGVFRLLCSYWCRTETRLEIEIIFD